MFSRAAASNTVVPSGTDTFVASIVNSIMAGASWGSRHRVVTGLAQGYT